MDLIKDILNTDDSKLNEISDKIYNSNRNDLEYWNFMITNSILTEDIIIENLKFLDRELLIKNQKLTSKVIENEQFIESDNLKLLNLLLSCQSLDMDCLENIIKTNKEIDWFLISKFQNLSIFFMEKYKEQLDWNIISENQFLPLNYIKVIKDRINFDNLGNNVKIHEILNDEFVESFKNENIWNCLIWSSNISDECLESNLHKLNQSQILDLLEVRKLDFNLLTNLINKYSHIDNLFDYILEGQELEESYITENIDKMPIDTLVKNQNLSFEFLYSIKDKFSLKDLSYNDNLNENLIKEILEIKNEFNGDFDLEYIKENLDLTLPFLNYLNSLNL